MRTITILELEKKFSHLDFHAADMRIFSLFINNHIEPMAETKILLIRWLQTNGVFPLHMYMTTYDDTDITSALKAKKVLFKIEKIKSQIIFNIEIRDQDEVERVIGEFFSMISHSEIMLIATKDVKITMCDSIHLASAAMLEETFVLMVEQDGQGIQLLTTKKEWFTEEGFIATMNEMKQIGYETTYYGLSK